jgi:hypothetical protein
MKGETTSNLFAFLSTARRLLAQASGWEPAPPSTTWNLLAGNGHCGREVSPPAAELVVHADGEQLDIAIVGVDRIATKRRRARAYRKGLVA